MKRDGFLLFEVVLYGFLISCICLSTFAISLYCIQSLKTLSKKIGAARPPYALLLVLENDIECASLFLNPGRESLFFKKKYIGKNQELSEKWSEWRMHKGRLEHIQGLFDELTNTWKEKSRTIMLYDVQNFSWKFHYKKTNREKIVGVTLAIQTSRSSIEKIIVFKNCEFA